MALVEEQEELNFLGDPHVSVAMPSGSMTSVDFGTSGGPGANGSTSSGAVANDAVNGQGAEMSGGVVDMFKQSSHPGVSVAHVAFKIVAIVW
eukprot:CAMPEP_0203763808 /NCGR_PEP_ID=MMETSP0098-20131031/16903_1 /ASSEMBLY_ACC=CAM_ASM_000208 /TAXON_ID=96639 /ORGANISM=" , Strain NY0313808BC1" /LENGTH=91 /DNA_ID=CAMNT_0050659055 /DNA_START=99 /DNA_END=371 /DNA_ORIENTATION=+